MRIALFITCIGDTFFPEAGRRRSRCSSGSATRSCCRREQTCCGQLHANSGHADEAVALARRSVEVFDGAEVVVAPSSSCVGTVRELYPELARRAGRRGAGGAARASSGRRVFELSELLVDVLGVTDVGAAFPHRVASTPRATRSADEGRGAPLVLLRHVRGLELVDLARADECCGLGGTFAITNVDTRRARCSRTSSRRSRPRARTSAPPSTARVSCTSRGGSCAPEPGPRRPPGGDPGLHVSSFPTRARRELANVQLRRNLRGATDTIRAKRARVVAEVPDWEELREAGRTIKADVLARLDEYLVEFEAAAQAAGATVHWARDADEANAVVADVARAHDADEVVKVKSLTTDEIGLNDALGAAGIHALETDFAELILQLDGDWSSHILVPAIHRNRTEIRDLFARTIAPGLESDDPSDLAEAVARLPPRAVPARAGRRLRRELRRRRDGDDLRGRVRGQRPHVHDPPARARDGAGDREARTAPGRSRGLPAAPAPLRHRGAHEPVHVAVDGRHARRRAEELHVVLLDNGRTRVLRDAVGRQALACIRCSACLNVCPVYSRTGGHAYGSVYPGPIGAILTPQLLGIEQAPSLPFASSLCGACYEVCPVKIDIPSVLLHLRASAVDAASSRGERAAFGALTRLFAGPRRFRAAQRAARIGGRVLGRTGRIRRLPPPLAGWTRTGTCGHRRGARSPTGGTRGERPGDRARPGTRRDRRRPAARAGARPPAPRRPWPAGASPPVLRARRRVPRRGTACVGRGRGLGAAVTEACSAAGATRVVVPTALPAAWRPDGVSCVEDDALTPHELDALDGVVTGSTVAVAETGTIVPSAAPDEGRRALTLVPDLHVRRPRRRDRRAPAGGVRPPGPARPRGAATADVRLRPLGHVGHRAPAGRRRARPSPARGDRRRPAELTEKPAPAARNSRMPASRSRPMLGAMVVAALPTRRAPRRGRRPAPARVREAPRRLDLEPLAARWQRALDATDRALHAARAGGLAVGARRRATCAHRRASREQ